MAFASRRAAANRLSLSMLGRCLTSAHCPVPLSPMTRLSARNPSKIRKPKLVNNLQTMFSVRLVVNTQSAPDDDSAERPLPTYPIRAQGSEMLARSSVGDFYGAEPARPLQGLRSHS